MDSVFKNKDVLITGGLGFIGSNVAMKLVGLGARVCIVDALMPDYGGNMFNVEEIKGRIQVTIADIRDNDRIEGLVRGRDYIFNIAGQISHIDSMNDPLTDLEINCQSQLVFLEACRHNNPQAKIAFASTRQVYGKPVQLPVNEDHPILPCDINGINKMAGEWYHSLYSRVYGMRIASLRLTNTYGPHLLMKHNRQGFIGWFIRQAIDGEEIQIYGDGTQIRDLNYVDDVADALLMAASQEECWGKVFNLGAGEHISLLAFTQLIIKIAGSGSYRLVPFPSEKKKIDIGSYFADFSKFSNISGWYPRVFLEEGLKKTIDFYRKYKEFYWD
ncbi:MAG: NAD-dependent epimerase/dehydratase family protein [Candidatus Omnitrophota bacterium]|nr:NAD-dependent epimerase/dehydratase family protein [Candidatus Omnitrophota bacterium]